MTRGPIETLEAAVHLLRQAPAAALLWQWSGSAPFALGAIFFWKLAANSRTSGAALAAASFGMALLLLWMNLCRGMFAGRLRRSLISLADPAPRLRSILPSQSLLGATKLILMPLAALIVFPLADVTASYRFAAALGGGFSKARKLAAIERADNWRLLLLLAFIWLVLAINVALGLAMLPQLLRILTGHESSFTRSGVHYILSPLFAILVLMVTWLVFDPFIQAVYTVRGFHLESLETGGDLRAGLRRIRDAARVIAACLALWAIPSAQSAIPPDRLDEAIRRAEKSPEYDWRLPVGQKPAAESWFVQTVDRVIARVKAAFQRVGRAIGRAIDWLLEKLRGVPAAPSHRGSAPVGVPVSTWALTAVAAAAIVFFAWRWLRARPPKSAPTIAAPVVAPRLDDEELTADKLPEEQWLALADQAIREQNFRLALRALYLANLAYLGRRGLVALDAAKTNREYEAELRRRGRAFPEARGLFSTNVALFEQAWYGLRPVSPEDLGEFRGRSDEMKRLVTA